MSGRFSRSIYVGNLPADIKELEVEDLFYKVCHIHLFKHLAAKAYFLVEKLVIINRNYLLGLWIQPSMHKLYL